MGVVDIIPTGREISALIVSRKATYLGFSADLLVGAYHSGHLYVTTEMNPPINHKWHVDAKILAFLSAEWREPP
jgi:hypothetical protein